MSSARFLVGIDLGTTNSAVAYVDLGQRGAPRVQLFEVPQLVADSEVAARPTLPSFLYFPPAGLHEGDAPREDEEGEDASAERKRHVVVGTYAREQGALQPTRQVSSSKSWLCHPAVDRAAPILPWGAEHPFISPVEASAAILRHIRECWNDTLGAGGEQMRLERQDVVLTLPASFDQEARTLTLQAAHAAGLERLTLLEEPLAAFYAWMSGPRSARGPSGGSAFRDGDQVLVCDVGGGTSDFSLIRVAIHQGEVSFERTAVGDHLLLGGDNLDLALARHLEAKLGDRALTLVQRLALRRSASAAKERLLSDPACERVTVSVLGSGRSVVGGTLTTELTRDEVTGALAEGFLPLVESSARPARDRRLALRELGLPYAEDPAITRHLAAFLRDAAASGASSAAGEAARPDASGTMARPDAVLFNGGFFTPRLARERVIENLVRWFADGTAWQPAILENEDLAAAVARGAAHFALVCRSGGLRVRAGSSRAYYIGIEAEETDGQAGVCILPRGTEEGTTFEIGQREFAVMTNRPVSFALFSSAIRHDPVGALVTLDGPDVHAHAPLTTVLRYGKKTRQVELAVNLDAAYTETGTLDVSCASRTSEHRWRLQFDLRGERAGLAEGDLEETEATAVVTSERLEAARRAIVSVFAEAGTPTPADIEAAGALPDGLTETGMTPEALPAHLETTLGFGRQAWPLAVIRALADTLLEVAAGRKAGPRFEARWLNLFGFCLRPGFGTPLDTWRIDQARTIYVEGLQFPNDLQCQAEWIVLWQRVAGGLKAGQQRELFQRYATMLGVRGATRPKRVPPQIEREAWRLLASLEHLAAAERVKLGDALLKKLARDQDNAGLLWALGRLGARMPAHGPVTAIVPPERAEAWIDRLLSFRTLTGDAAAAIAQIGGKSDDPLRDIGEEARRRALDRLTAAGFEKDAQALREFQAPAARDARQVFGESLPAGLRTKA